MAMNSITMSDTKTLTVPIRPLLPVTMEALPKTTISDLPEEIVECVLRLIRDTFTPAEFWTCLRTCRRFHRIGLGVHGRLDYAVSAIVESHTRRHDVKVEDVTTRISISTNYSLKPASQQFISQLRSLTVHVLHVHIATPFNPIAGLDLFDGLCQTFSVMRKLTTFSLKFSDEGWDFPSLDVPAIPQSRLAQLVAALPATVIDLELDTASTDIPPKETLINQEKESHLCYQIGKIFPRLHYLRLRVGHICNDLLGSGVPCRNCSCARGCTFCSGDAQHICLASRSWNIRASVVWLPWGQGIMDDSVSDLCLLLKMNTTHVLFTVISQSDRAISTRAGIDTPASSPYHDFVWTTSANYWPFLDETLNVYGKSDSNRSAGAPTFAHEPCAEHLALSRAARRHFSIGTHHKPNTPYSALAQWDLERLYRWAQDGHGGCRYPIFEGDRPNLRFWKASHGPPPPGAIRPSALGKGAGLFACIFPMCEKRLESLNHLRGHLMFWHSENPHDHVHNHVYPCPSFGCSRIGIWGFYQMEELEEHLLSHHVRPCSLDPRTASLNLRNSASGVGRIDE